MPSTYTTDPIGPRSVDEMLHEVYSRTGQMRRRRAAQRVGAAAVALVIASAGVVSLRGGDHEARVRVADDRTGQEEATAPPAVDAGAHATPGVEASASAGEGARQEAAKPREVDATVRKPAEVPSIPSEGRTTLETWAHDTDKLHDSSPEDWYFDIAGTSMTFDAKAELVIFTTTYRQPDAPTTEVRLARDLESSFDYEGQAYTIRVREDDNELGQVTVDDVYDCPTCSPHFDPATATLTVKVPLDRLNDAVGQRGTPLASGADIMSVRASTVPLGGIAPADATNAA